MLSSALHRVGTSAVLGGSLMMCTGVVAACEGGGAGSGRDGAQGQQFAASVAELEARLSLLDRVRAMLRAACPGQAVCGHARCVS